MAKARAVSGAASANSANLTTSVQRGAGHGRYGLGVYKPHWMAATVSPVHAVTPVFTPAPAMLSPNRGLRPREDFGAPVIAAGAGSSDAGLPGPAGLSAVSAAAYNSMASMNHMRFECGVDLGALRHAGGKRLLRALWAAPDSKDALSIGYMTLTTAH